MKDFFKFTLATVTGVFIAGGVLFVFAVITLFGMLSASGGSAVVKENTVMRLDLNGTLVDHLRETPIELLSPLLGDGMTVYGLDDILASIRKAKENENIKGIYLRAGSLSASYASLQELRAALLDFKESGKFIVAYADNYTQGMYYLSSVADEVTMNPKGMLEWRGIASTPLFYKELLRKAGVEMQVFKVGNYKSAVEPFTATEMSPENREQTEALVRSLWRQVMAGVADARSVSVDSLNAYADQALMFYPAEESVRRGLIDTLVYADYINGYLKSRLNMGEEEKLPLLGLDEMMSLADPSTGDTGKDRIAVYYAAGEIVDKADISSTEETIVREDVLRDLRELKEDERVKAVVLRVNSPGGSAFASEQIWHAVNELRAKKPVVASMGDYAASGGYYIACAADSIVAQPATLTGSIGIFGMIPNAKGLADKLGLTSDVVKTNRHSDVGGLMRPLDGEEKSLMQMMINQGYATFVSRCAEGRRMSEADIEKVAGGRVWTGEAAVESGLVDTLGGIGDALRIAAAKASLEKYEVVSYPGKEDLFFSLFNAAPSGWETRALRRELGEYYRPFSLLKNLWERSPVQARVPFELNIR